MALITRIIGMYIRVGLAMERKSRAGTLKPSRLEMSLQQLRVPSNNVAGLEQYCTPPHIAANLLWDISHHFCCIKDEIVLDLGCGNGILGIGCHLLGSKFVVAVDVDKTSLQVAKDNAEFFGLSDKNIAFVNQDVRFFDVENLNIPSIDHFDVVVMNPPFGTRDQVGIDAVFIEKALGCAHTVYSMHKTSTRQFWISKGAKLGVQVNPLTKLKFNIDSCFKFHKSKSMDIEVDFLQFKHL